MPPHVRSCRSHRGACIPSLYRAFADVVRDGTASASASRTEARAMARKRVRGMMMAVAGLLLVSGCAADLVEDVASALDDDPAEQGGEIVATTSDALEV